MPVISRPLWTRPGFVGTAVVLALIGIGTLLLMRPVSDGMEAYPHSFIAEPGYDPGLIVSVAAPIEAPPPAPPGLEPAWQCDDPAFRDAQARPWLFPVATSDAPPVLPVHPQLKRRPSLSTCRRYRSPEAESQLASYRARQQP